MRSRLLLLTRDLAELNVQPTEPICTAGRRCLRELIDEMARPSGGTSHLPGRRHPYQEYKEGLRWLVENGCPARQELDDDLSAAVKRCEPTPERAKFAAFVAALRARSK